MVHAGFLERDAPLETLGRHMATAFSSSSGKLILVGGEAGVGKTALVKAFLSDLPSGPIRLTGACEALSAPRPLGPLLDFSHHISDEFKRLVEVGGERQRIFSLFADRLRSAPRPHVVVLEDVHWADDATLDLLRFLGRRVGEWRAILLATYRDDEVGPTHPLRRVLGDLAGLTSVHKLKIAPLSLTAVEHLAADTTIDATELYRRTGGNSFFVTEVLATPKDELPANVSDAVLARVSRLSQPARDALETAAVLGSNHDLGLLERLVPYPEAVEECLSHGLLTSTGSTSTFRHELARDAVLAAMPATRRRRTHAVVLNALEEAARGGIQERATAPGESTATPSPDELGVSPDALAVLAHHAAEAGDAERVLRYAPAAGHLAMRFVANREARTQFQRALPYASTLGPSGHAQLLESYARACSLTSQTSEALWARDLALKLWRSVGDPLREAQALSRQGGALYDAGRKAEAESAMLEAVRQIEKLPEGGERSSVFQMYASLRMLDRDAASALRWARKAVASGTRTGNVNAVASAYNTIVGVLTTSERLGEARRYHRACVDLIASGAGVEPNVNVASAKMMMGSGLGEVYRFTEAERLLADAIDLSAPLDLDATHDYALAWRALCLLYLGRWREAGEAGTWVLGRSNALIISRIMSAVAIGRLRARRGDPEVWPVLDVALERALATDTLQRLAPVRAARAEAALAAGWNERAIEEARAALPLALEHRHRWFVGELSYLIFRAGGDPELPAWVDGPFALQVRGDPAMAANAWKRLGCPFEHARALSEVDSPQALQLAFDVFTKLGAKPAATTVAERLRARGVRGVPRGPRRVTAAHPVGLTAREQQVLALLVQGLTNSEIAQRNEVSPRTVENQVSAVLGKLEARTRTEAVAKAHSLGLLELAAPH